MPISIHADHCTGPMAYMLHALHCTGPMAYMLHVLLLVSLASWTALSLVSTTNPGRKIYFQLVFWGNKGLYKKRLNI